jgi:hypothetical protein
MFGGPGVGVAGQDLRIAQRDAGIQRIGYRGVPQRVRADMPRDPRGLRDPLHHPVHVTSIGFPENGRNTTKRSWVQIPPPRPL